MYPDLFQKVVDFHGHCCPGIVYGFRVALAALKEFGERAKDEELVVIAENDSCSIDAIQVVAGCTFGKGNFMFKDYGKQVYTFLSRKDRTAVRFSVKPLSVEETEEEKEAWKFYTAGSRSPEILEIIERRKKKKIDFLLAISSSELLHINPCPIKLPEKARLYQSVVCEQCFEKVMEPRARLKHGKVVCIPCFEL